MQRHQRPSRANNPEPPEAVFARRLREERTARGLSMKVFAAAVTERLGVMLYDSAVARIEGGTQTPTLPQAVAIAQTLELDLLEMVDPAPAMDAPAALAQAEARLADLEAQEQVIATERQIAASRVKRLRDIVRRQEQP